MPIVINRATGEAAIPVITPAQQESLLGVIIQAYLEKHPEVFDDPGET